MTHLLLEATYSGTAMFHWTHCIWWQETSSWLRMILHYGLLLCMGIIPVSSGTVYIQSGSDITDCNMKCPEDDVTVELFRKCGGVEKTLLENHCYFNHTKSHDPRLRLHTGSGCWKLTHARKDDSGVYKVWCYDIPEYLISSTEIRVLDPVLISNITSNGSRLGEETAVSVQFSGEESAVTWEVDGELLPETYRLIDDNRTLIIPGVQRDDAERRFRVRITNPVSEEIREYQLIDDPIFRKLLERKDYGPNERHRGVTVGVFVAAVLILGIIYVIRRKCSRKLIPATQNGTSYTSVPQHNGSVPAVTENKEPEAILIHNGSVPAIPENKEPEAILIHNGSVPAIPENKEPEAILIHNGSVPAVPENKEPEAILIHNGSVPAVPENKEPEAILVHNGSLPDVSPRMDPMPPLSRLEILSHTNLCMTQMDP